MVGPAASVTFRAAWGSPPWVTVRGRRLEHAGDLLGGDTLVDPVGVEVGADHHGRADREWGQQPRHRLLVRGRVDQDAVAPAKAARLGDAPGHLPHCR